MAPLILSVTLPKEEILEKVNKLKPHIINGYASGALLLATAQLAGKIDIFPKRIVTSGEVLTSETRDTVRKAWGIEIADLYACSESICLGIKEKDERPFTLFNDFHCFELLNDKGEEVNETEPGRLILTNLYNYTQPLIRYRMDDLIIRGSRQELNHDSFQHVERIIGRSGDTLSYLNSRNQLVKINHIHLVEFFCPGIEKFQFTQPAENTLKFRFTSNSLDDLDLLVIRIKSRLIEILESYGLSQSVIIQTEHLKNIENDPVTKKFKLIVPYSKNASLAAA